MEKLNVPALYALQDRVLEAVFSTQTSFYLTGGTCLHRFYHQCRFSMDLDLFTNEANLFREDARRAREALDRHGISQELLVDTRDFIRIMVQSELQVDLVNDRVHRVGACVRNREGIVLDNMLNLAANKVCAVLGRDDPKDVFDLHTIFKNTTLRWSDVMAEAGKKCALDPEALYFRLASFPLNLLDLLHVPDKKVLDGCKREYLELVKAIRESLNERHQTNT